jgi:prolyl 4-hydroxylase
MRKHWINDSNCFIAGWYADDVDELCDNLIDHYDNHPQKYVGCFGDGKVDKSKKDSHDISLLPDNPLTVQYYDRILEPSLKEYVNLYNRVSESDRWRIETNPQLQHYAPGGGYHLWHSERDCMLNSTRWLVYMTYLNDVEEGGETAFMYQGVKIKPERGLTLLWPTDWTHTHKGIVAPNENKYIITGWYEWATV